MVRTLIEIQGGRVSVTVDGASSSPGPSELYDPAKAAEVMAENYVRAQAQIKELEARLEKGHVCTPACRPNAHVAFEGRARVRELEAEADRCRQMIIDLSRELEAETKRADENRDWAERAEARLASISGAVHGIGVSRALQRGWAGEDALAMAGALKQVRDALGTPGLPETASEPTSQA